MRYTSRERYLELWLKGSDVAFSRGLRRIRFPDQICACNHDAIRASGGQKSSSRRDSQQGRCWSWKRIGCPGCWKQSNPRVSRDGQKANLLKTTQQKSFRTVKQ